MTVAHCPINKTINQYAEKYVWKICPIAVDTLHVYANCRGLVYNDFSPYT